jgi:hypothetical protein
MAGLDQNGLDLRTPKPSRASRGILFLSVDFYEVFLMQFPNLVETR